MRKNSRRFYPSDEQKLRRAMTQITDKRTYIRMQAVLLRCEGKPIREIMTVVSKTRQAIHKWVRLFLQTHDPFSLCEHDRSGRPQAAVAISEDRILKALQTQPREAGYRVNSWTVKTLAHYLNKRYQAGITTITLRRRMKQMGLRYKRPRYVYEEKAPHISQKKGLLSES